MKIFSFKLLNLKLSIYRSNPNICTIVLYSHKFDKEDFGNTSIFFFQILDLGHDMTNLLQPDRSDNFYVVIVIFFLQLIYHFNHGEFNPCVLYGFLAPCKTYTLPLTHRHLCYPWKPLLKSCT